MSARGTRGGALLRAAEMACWALGFGAVLCAGGAVIDGWVMSRVALASFAASTEALPAAPGPVAPPAADAPIAVLRIDELGLKVPVFDGTARIALRRGAGSIEGTTPPGEHGHIGIAAHRDSFFRPLKDIRQGAVIELATGERVQRFRVTEIRIVDALDVSVLEPTDEPCLTLVTCYPFNYVGFAPDRFIVHAALE